MGQPRTGPMTGVHDALRSLRRGSDFPGLPVASDHHGDHHFASVLEVVRATPCWFHNRSDLRDVRAGTTRDRQPTGWGSRARECGTPRSARVSPARPFFRTGP
jgi:hypothetical protein